MIEIKTVLDDYPKTAKGRVPFEATSESLKKIRNDIPEKFRQFIDSINGQSSDYKIYGSAGQLNFSYAQIPWVGVFKISVTKSAQRGFYIVLLFSRDMRSAWLSLNQGFTDYTLRYKPVTEALNAVERCAAAALNYVSIPVGFTTGPILLEARNDLGIGYERGAIISKQYRIDHMPSSVGQIRSDFAALLSQYEKLAALNIRALTELDQLNEYEFQTRIESLVKESDLGKPTAGPQPRPMSKLPTLGSGEYRRDATVAVRAIKNANYQCSLGEVKDMHTYFESRRTNKNYVEAHHLIPFSQQSKFEFSLDVEENIVSLCAGCHKLLHYGLGSTKRPLIQYLLGSRAAGLKYRGILVTLEALVKMYDKLQDFD